jgi:hypothetical protein
MVERTFLRLVLSAIILGMTALFAPFMVLLKAAEGVYVAWQITRESLRQAWQEDPHRFLRRP